MRTTINIESDALAAAKEIARVEGTAVGKVIFRLVRQALTGQGNPRRAAPQTSAAPGFSPFPSRGEVATNELTDRLRDAQAV